MKIRQKSQKNTQFWASKPQKVVIEQKSLLRVVVWARVGRSWRTTRHDAKRCRLQAAKAGYVNRFWGDSVKIRNPNDSRIDTYRSKILQGPVSFASADTERCSKYLCQKIASAVHECLLNCLTAPTRVAPPTHDVCSSASSDWPRALGALLGVVTFLQHAPSAL